MLINEKLPAFIKRKSLLILTFITLITCSYAQKPAIDTSVYEHWPSVGQPANISSNGKYAFYTLDDKRSEGTTLVLKSITANRKLELEGVRFAIFTRDSRMMLFTKGKDSLGIITLENQSIEYISHIISSNLSWPRYSEEGIGKWMIYKLDSANKPIVVRNLETGKQRRFEDVADYSINNQENILLLQIGIGKDSPWALHWIDLLSDNNAIIWKGAKTDNFIFDHNGSQLAFVAHNQANYQHGGTIWHYKPDMKRAEMLIDSTHLRNIAASSIITLMTFNIDGSKLFFNLKKPDSTQTAAINAPRVDIWSYRDPKLQSQQLAELHNTPQPVYTYVINFIDRSIIRVEYENEKIIALPGGSDDKFVLVSKKGKGDIGDEWNWNNTATVSIYLMSTVDGTRKLLTPRCAPPLMYSYTISPAGKYIVYYDPIKQNYFSYTISSGVICNITQTIQTKWTSLHRNDEPLAPYELMGQAGWLNDDHAVLLYDQNDIFSIDPAGKHPPVNLTGGYGHKHGIQFRLAISHPSTFQPDENLLLSAFSRITKSDGFFTVTLGKKEAPKLLSLQPYTFGGSIESDNFEPEPPVRAHDANIYLVRRMSAEESPNYFVTSDFKTYSSISDIYPEKNYNWLRSELISWKTKDGKYSQGILYKPENFDSRKKYPVIFYYYEKSSEGLHAFIKPELENGVINIPYYVSNGYLIFTPDIYYTIGHPGRSACRSIVSAANYLAKMPWVDKNRMGIQGHSFGGYETNYIVTHTNIFAAACSASGWADFVSAYNAIREGGGGVGRRYYYEMYRERMGGTLWNKKDQYIESSPIFNADRVTTPVLMMNNIKDRDVSFFYGIEFFSALRRLGKKAWMLQYDGEDHVIFDEIAAKDFHIRMKQFFDHYLKDAPAPKWMIEGIPAKMKGFDQGYELEPAGVTPGPGLLIDPSGKKLTKKVGVLK